MFNAPLPRVEDLPSSAQLLRSTLVSAAIAGGLLVTVLLPAEYAVDPARIGRVLGLTQMGEIKRQLAEEAAADQARGASLAAIEQRMAAVEEQMGRLEPLVALAQGIPSPPPASRPVAAAPAPVPSAPAGAGRSDETVLTLRPDQGIEIKLRMRRGAEARFAWRVNAGHVNFDTHGEPPNAARGFYHGYGTGRSVTQDEGRIVAAFDGTHGWFFRNRSGRTVTITLRTEGDYDTIIRPNG
ncbi:transmembrane anchor protein [Falsiroseomonas bella]|uniref:Transmembrane anchor protein n=1 Tax=Falsiroseomonas bella TaxID=2184016 RepID=A0A317FE88_9PROT|nr:transmembrane anchor protein [Falsiroseomonas bella]PWS35898.1 transmembrane anchor protein [Falsiroseomonas bella]